MALCKAISINEVENAMAAVHFKNVYIGHEQRLNLLFI